MASIHQDKGPSAPPSETKITDQPEPDTNEGTIPSSSSDEDLGHKDLEGGDLSLPVNYMVCKQLSNCMTKRQK